MVFYVILLSFFRCSYKESYLESCYLLSFLRNLDVKFTAVFRFTGFILKGIELTGVYFLKYFSESQSILGCS